MRQATLLSENNRRSPAALLVRPSARLACTSSRRPRTCPLMKPTRRCGTRRGRHVRAEVPNEERDDPPGGVAVIEQPNALGDGRILLVAEPEV